MFAVVFDFDGTILDSETAEFESHEQLFSECGATLTVEEWCEGVGIVTPADHWFVRLRDRATHPPIDYEQFVERRRAYFRARVRWELMPGIAELLDELTGAGVPCAVASTATGDWVTRALRDLGLATRFDAVVTGDEVEHGKPAPDVYLEAARRLGIDPRWCVAVEDSGPGLTAASAAGMKTVVIPHTLSLNHDFANADLQVSHAGELTLARLQRLIDSGRPGSDPGDASTQGIDTDRGNT
jgi:HAD superfamily hydrolase (TIGR01509 family)